MLDAARLGTSAKYRHHDKNMTVPPLNLYDNRNTHDALHPLPVSKRKQMDSRVKLNQNSVIRNDRNKNFHVCSVRQKLSPSDTDCPSLTSITYRTTDSEPDNKSLVYTISVPYKGKSSRSLSDLSSRSAGQGQRILPKRKFVSTMNVDITVQNSKNGAKNYNAFSCKGPTNYQELDLDPCDPLSCDSEFGRTKDNHMTFHELSDLNNFQKQSAKNRHEVLHTYDGDLDLLHSNRSDFTQNGASLRHKLYHEKKSKEALASAKRQMVDWLLSNQRLNSEMQNSESAKQYGHQLSMSTPSLKVKQFSNKHLLSNQDCLERRSFDSQELLKEGRQSVLGRHSKYVRKSFDSQDILNADSRDSPMSSHEFFHYKPQGHFPEDFRCDDSVVSGEECVGPQKRVSLIESSLGTSEDHLEYLKLARLVNGPSNLMVSIILKAQNCIFEKSGQFTELVTCIK